MNTPVLSIVLNTGLCLLGNTGLFAQNLGKTDQNGPQNDNFDFFSTFIRCILGNIFIYN